MTMEEFIIRSIQKNDNKYDYSKAVYVNANTKVVIGGSKGKRCCKKKIVHAAWYQDTLLFKFGHQIPL